MFDLLPTAMADRIALFAALVALLALGVSFYYSLQTRRQSVRIEKSQAYLQLEVASSDVFKYEAEKAEVLKPYRLTRVTDAQRKAALANVEHAMTAYNLYFQTLNLMEVCTRFRRQDIIEHQVFASWVAWCYDTLDDWYFRHQWSDFRANYTDDVRAIFDIGVELFSEYRFGNSDDDEVDAARKACFYAAVADPNLMDCEEIAGWLNKTAQRASDTEKWTLWLDRKAPRRGPAEPKPVPKPRASSRASSAATPVTSATAKSSAG